MSMVYNEMLNKKKQAEKLAQMGKNKYEYDSDEDTEVSIKETLIIEEYMIYKKPLPFKLISILKLLQTF